MYPWITLGPVTIPTFFIVNTLVASYAFLWSVSRAEQRKLSAKFVADLTLILMISALVGARLFHVFYENLDFYKEHPQNIFFLWEGGFVFYGGFLSSLAVGWIYVRRTQKITAPYFDLYAPVLSFTYAIGRIGCFLNGCCYGTHCELPWAVDGRHPAQLYATLWELGILFLLIGVLEKSKKLRPGMLFAVWALLHSCGRFLIELLRDDFRGPAYGLSISSWISILIFIAALIWIIFPRKSRSE